jgi:general secretion pathway protein K
MSGVLPAYRSDRSHTAGVAMVIVLWVILVLSLMISGFAFTMHVESQLKAEMLARSGIEVARMQLILDLRSSTEGGYDALNQEWATNDLYVAHELGEGTFNVTVIDEESKLPINRATPEQLKRLMDVLGIEQVDGDVIVDSLLDWIDDNDLHRLNGAESDYYMSLSPPYKAKNAPLDRVEELLLVRGVTPEIFYGTPAAEKEEARPGLSEFVTTLSSGQVNVNTASSTVLQAWLGLDATIADAIVNRRDGADGIAGTEDDLPFRSVEEFVSGLGARSQPEQQQMSSSVTVNSSYFTVKSTGDVSGVKRTITAVLFRDGSNTRLVAWREARGGS